MIRKLKDEIAANPPREIHALIKLMGTVSIEDQYRTLVNKELQTFPDFANRQKLLEMGYFLGPDLVQLVHGSGDGLTAAADDFIGDRLCAHIAAIFNRGLRAEAAHHGACGEMR